MLFCEARNRITTAVLGDDSVAPISTDRDYEHVS